MGGRLLPSPQRFPLITAGIAESVGIGRGQILILKYNRLLKVNPVPRLRIQLLVCISTAPSEKKYLWREGSREVSRNGRFGPNVIRVKVLRIK